jgi:XisH protein
MAARDFYHEHVKTALTKDGWTITDDPFTMKWLGTTLYVDLGAERLIAAEKGAEKIAVEIKSFAGASRIEDLRDALGQFLIYRASLKIYEPNRHLFLAIHRDVYDNTLGLPEGDALRLDEKISLIVFDVDKKEIVKWIS